ncbi:MAG TPA: FAD-binding oxidoreductase [Smithellaceae bacterium]|nr:FAD-binding oxidoreductase [Smithellaceae bacterium]
MKKDKDQIKQLLVSIVGQENISGEVPDLIPYIRDSYSTMMGRNIPLPDFVVMPETVDEVQKIVLLANDYLIPIYPRSIGVNIAGSALPYKEGGIILDLKRMNKILEINEDTMTATIQPGVTWGQLRKEANKKKLDIIPIGGPYQTSPVGNHLLTNVTPYSSKYHCDRAMTLKVILPNGKILRTGSWASEHGGDVNPYFRYAYGPDITGMFRGSLGNFGIIVEMVERLRPVAPVEKEIAFGFKELGPCLKALQAIERLEFTRTCQVYNNILAAHLCLAPHRIKEPGEREKLLAKLPPYQLGIGLGGTEEMVALFEKIAAEEAGKRGGYSVPVELELESVAKGASRAIMHMYAPLSGFAAIIGCLPITHVAEINDIVKEAVKKYDVRDPLTGEPQEHELIVVPYDRSSTVYVEQEILYDPAADRATLEPVMQCLRECYAKIVVQYGASHTIPNKTLMKMLVPSYGELLVNFKKMVDPNGIMLPGGPYSLE